MKFNKRWAPWVVPTTLLSVLIFFTASARQAIAEENLSILDEVSAEQRQELAG